MLIFNHSKESKDKILTNTFENYFLKENKPKKSPGIYLGPKVSGHVLRNEQQLLGAGGGGVLPSICDRCAPQGYLNPDPI